MVSQKKLFDLSERVSVVTGGGGGLGRTMATGLASYGSNVVIVDVNLNRAKNVVEEIKSMG